MTEVSSNERPPRAGLTFLLDVDNTLLDNDALKAEIGLQVDRLVGAAGARRFWELYEQVRSERDFVDYPATIARWVDETGRRDAGQRLTQMTDNLDFRTFLYPHSLDVLQYLGRFGPTVILSDGDSQFQPMKIRKSGLEAAVQGRVLISVHKEEELAKVFTAFPSDRYVMIDDKARILSILEQCCPSEFTTVHVLQGHYATEQYSPPPDYTIASIGELLQFSPDRFSRGRPGAVSRESQDSE